MSKPLRVGVVGCGAIAQRVHVPLLSARNDVVLAAVADIDDAAHAALMQRYSRVQPYHDLDAMLADAALDAVVIALPIAQLAAAACAAFDAGCHVFVEKPLAATLPDAAAALDAWRRSGRVGTVGFNCRGNPLCVRLRALLHAGRAGTPLHMRTIFTTSPRALPVWKQRRDSGGGALLDLGAHHIDLIRYLTGREVVGARATIRSRITEHDTALLELQLDGGITAHVFAAFGAAETERVEVVGDAARLAVSRFTSLDIDIHDNAGAGGGAFARVFRRAVALRHIPRALDARRAPLREPGYAVLLDRFVRAARAGVPFTDTPDDTPDIAEGFACVAVIAAAEQSLVSGVMEAPALTPAAPDARVPTEVPR